MTEQPEYTTSSGNVFADLGLPDAEELKAKSDLMLQITRLIEERGLTQAEAAQIMGVDQPKVSALVNGKMSGFSMERLYRFLNSMGQDIEIVVTPTPKNREQAHISVSRKGNRQPAGA